MLFGRRCCCMPKQNMCCCPQMDPCMEQPVVEPTVTKCIEKEFCHEVQHVCPVHTHVINKHFIKHTYTPQYSCSEENQIIDTGCGGCNQF
ncbi:MAG: CotD family spore coat protein [Bacilli bacterium]|nr:CotD family spore coat protein [Bacilli bacterium]